MQALLWFLGASMLLAAAARLKMRCAMIEGPIAGEAPMWVFVTSRWSRGSTRRSRFYRTMLRLLTVGSWMAAAQAWLFALESL